MNPSNSKDSSDSTDSTNPLDSSDSLHPSNSSDSGNSSNALDLSNSFHSSDWKSLVILWLPIGVALAWLIQKASWFWENNPDMQFGYVIPILAGYLLFEGFERQPSLRTKCSFVNVFLMLIGIAFLFLTQIYQAAYGLTATSMTGLGLGFLAVSWGHLLYIYGLAGLKAFGFGLAFILIAIPIPSVIYGEIISILQKGIAVVNVDVLMLLGTPASIQGNLVRLSPDNVLGIDEACSGIRSLQSALMATLFIGYLTLNRWSMRAFLLVAGLMLAVFGNFIRVFSLSYSASKHGTQAVDAAHDFAGWSILAFTVVGVALLSWIFGKVETKLAEMKTPTPSSAESHDSSSAESSTESSTQS